MIGRNNINETQQEGFSWNLNYWSRNIGDGIQSGIFSGILYNGEGRYWNIL